MKLMLTVWMICDLHSFFSVLFCECEDDFFEDDADAVAPIATADGTFFAAVNDFFDDADADATFFDADADAEGLFAANAFLMLLLMLRGYLLAFSCYSNQRKDISHHAPHTAPPCSKIYACYNCIFGSDRRCCKDPCTWGILVS